MDHRKRGPTAVRVIWRKDRSAHAGMNYSNASIVLLGWNYLDSASWKGRP